mmetsp:Transcript_55697/g.118619  ORF Transcript_55697/g.118619 Transcript_55697/m.118619 type:complete len:564 (+) Transcript_55697:93-1784(+)
METEVLSRPTSRPSSATSQQNKLPPIANSQSAAGAAASSPAAAPAAAAPTSTSTSVVDPVLDAHAAPSQAASPLPWITASEPQSPTTSAAHSVAAAATRAALVETTQNICPGEDGDDPAASANSNPAAPAAEATGTEDAAVDPTPELAPHPPARLPSSSQLNLARARGWPHFVPRVELEVSLKEFREALQQLSGRIARQENRHRELQERFDAWALRADEDLATKNSVKALAGKLTIEVNACRRDFEEEVLEIRNLAALDEDLRKACEAHRSLDEAFRESSQKLQEAIDKNEQAINTLDAFSKATFATGEALAAHISETKTSHEGLQQRLKSVDEALVSHDDRHQSHESEQKELRQRQADHVLALKVTDTCLDSVKNDLSALTSHCNEDLARLDQLKEVANKLDNTNEAVDKSAADIKQLFEDLEEERALVRETHNKHSKNIREMHKLMDDCYEASKTKGDLLKRCEALEETVESEKAQQKVTQEELKQALELLTNNHGELHCVQDQHREEFMELLRQLELANESTRQYSTQFCLQQLDDALHLSKNITNVEEKHELLAQKVAA